MSKQNHYLGKTQQLHDKVKSSGAALNDVCSEEARVWASERASPPPARQTNGTFLSSAAGWDWGAATPAKGKWKRRKGRGERGRRMKESGPPAERELEANLNRKKKSKRMQTALLLKRWENGLRNSTLACFWPILYY